MLNLTQPVNISSIDIALREAADRRARGEWCEQKIEKPDWFPKFSIIMLVKNEWQTLREAVRSVLPIADELIIGLDKTTDEPLAFAYASAYDVKPADECNKWFDGFLADRRMPTVEEIAAFMEVDVAILQESCNRMAAQRPTAQAAKECLELVGKGEIFDIDFQDHFSNARNLTLEKATGDWCMFLDGHEMLQNAHVLYEVFEKLPKSHGRFYEVLVKLNELDVPCRPSIRQNRIFKRTPKAHFTRGVHNKLVIPEQEEDKDRAVPVGVDELVLLHDRPAFLSRFRDPQRQKMTLEHMGEGDDSSSLYYTGLSAHRRKDYAKAIEAYTAYLDQVEGGPEAAVICGQVGKLYQDSLGQLEDAEKWYREGTKRCPDAAWCWLALSHLRLSATNDMDAGDDRDGLLKEALTFARLADACVQPVSTMATPSTSFTWEAPLRMAHLHEQLENVPEALEQLNRIANMEDVPPHILTQVNTAFTVIQGVWVSDLSSRLRLSARNGQKVLSVYDHTGQFSNDVIEIGQSLGYRVKAFQEVDADSVYCADIWWVEWAAENAAVLSRMFKDDRKLVVRCHSYETFSPLPTSIYWDNVDVPIASAENVNKKLRTNFGIDTSRFKTLTVYPNPDEFPATVIPASQDVVFLGRFGSKKGVVRLPDLAAMLPERTIHVGGTIQDERLYDGIVEECLRRGINNLKFYGHISSGERLNFLQKGAHYVSLSPWETLSVALSEAQLVGLSCHALEYDWTDYLEDVAVCNDLKKMAESIRYRDEKPLIADRGKLVEKYTNMREAIREILAT